MTFYFALITYFTSFDDEEMKNHCDQLKNCFFYIFD